MDKLYIEDTIQTNKYSSLDKAFTLHPVIHIEENKMSLEEKIKKYKETSLF